ncbi:MAG: hypothetical protein UU67_C0068G0004 [Candidatus Daviesbacteria bacterium GW2011_GWB1_41_5]|uniref:Uncharacterized protein n=1 Tax=Candidatus Daviesbacteria bacterium GW2011_GWB1_41_5 TaxID=1618429 RepID=A0A0G0WI15_9BACT|nr:MAG: hypothetical protein UU67_C0068G0004 [Candidatus Daviesbacteria bacterium GW2011_GWB1_41_5]
MVKTKRAGPRPRTRSFGPKPQETRLVAQCDYSSMIDV